MPVDPQLFKNALGRFASGVTVVTTVDAEQRPQGLTATAFSSVSLEPPLVLVCVHRASASHGAVLASRAFTVNFLASDQEAVSRRFASRVPDRFAETPHRAGRQGVPVLEGALATLDCTLVSAHESGDHSIFVGQVESAETNETAPLVYFRGRYACLPTKQPE